MKRYWYRQCPVCKEGTLFVMKKTEEGSLYLLCEECFCAFKTPAEAFDGNNCQEGMDVQGVYASQEDIIKHGWSEYPFKEIS